MRCAKRLVLFIIFVTLVASVSFEPAISQSGEELIIDHQDADISAIPDQPIDSAQSWLKIHYAHTSHGEQLVEGMGDIEDSDTRFSFIRTDNLLPFEEGALCVFDGQMSETYITPELYWQTSSGMDMTRTVLDANPSINLSMWAWCTQLDYYTGDQVQAYLDSIQVLEAEYPGVTFVYMTGNAQATGSTGYNRYLRNEQIRQFCRDNGRILYDFADLDSWWFDAAGQQWEQSTYQYNGTQVPVEHPELAGVEAWHTSFESCFQKGKAVWSMVAMMSGWADSTKAVDSSWGELKGRFFRKSERGR